MSDTDTLPPCRETYEQAEREKLPYGEGADLAAVGLGLLVGCLLAREPYSLAAEEFHLYSDLRQILVGILTRRAAAVPCTLDIARWVPVKPTDRVSLERTEAPVRFLVERARQSDGQGQWWCISKHCWCDRVFLLEWSGLPREQAEDPVRIWRHRNEFARLGGQIEDLKARGCVVAGAERRLAGVNSRRLALRKEERAKGGIEASNAQYQALDAEDDAILADFAKEALPRLREARAAYCGRCEHDPAWKTQQYLSRLDTGWAPAYDAALLLKKVVELIAAEAPDTTSASLIIDAPSLLGQPAPPDREIGPLVREERVSPGKLRSLPEGGVARYYFPVSGRYGVTVFTDGTHIRGVWVDEGLRDDCYDLVDWPAVLSRAGFSGAGQPDVEAPAGLHWNDLGGAEVHVYADGLPERDGKVWSVQVYQAAASPEGPPDAAALHERITCILALQRALAAPAGAVRADTRRDALEAALDASAILDGLSDQGRTELNKALVGVTASGGDPATFLVGLLPPSRREAFPQPRSSNVAAPPALGAGQGFEALVTSPTAEMRTTASFREWAGGELVTLAIVFTDIVRSVPLGEQIRDEAMNEVRRAHYEQSRRLMNQYRGREVKPLGDGFMAAFRNAADALDYARALERDTGDRQVQVRAGIHVGQVNVEENDVFGSMVNLASRVAADRGGTGIWLSDHAKRDIDILGAQRHKPLEWERHDGVTLKGFSGTFTLWSLMGVEGHGT